MENSPSPHFIAPIRKTILRFPENEVCEMQSLDRTFELTDEDLDTVVATSNEPHLYNMVFRRVLNGQPYLKPRAEYFFSWGREGWDTNGWFVFAIRNSQKKIIAVIDIKSNTTAAAEIGYWASASSPGVMTNAVLQLCELAKEAGYASLFALVVPENLKSARVLQRAHFVEEERELIKEGRRYRKFVRENL